MERGRRLRELLAVFLLASAATFTIGRDVEPSEERPKETAPSEPRVEASRPAGSETSGHGENRAQTAETTGTETGKETAETTGKVTAETTGKETGKETAAETTGKVTAETTGKVTGKETAETTGKETGEKLLGINPDAYPLTVVALVLSLLLAAAVGLSASRKPLLTVAPFGLVFVILDIQELVHKIQKSQTSVVVFVVVVTAFHLAAVTTAILAWRVAGQPPRPS
jgi:hypothetical protein